MQELPLRTFRQGPATKKAAEGHLWHAQFVTDRRLPFQCNDTKTTAAYTDSENIRRSHDDRLKRPEQTNAERSEKQAKKLHPRESDCHGHDACISQQRRRL